METKWKQCRRLFHLGIVIALIMGLSLPSFVLTSQPALANENSDEEESNEHSGGFTVHADKVEGVMDPLEAMMGIIDIEEGVIHGLTMMKEIKTDENGTLVIKIKPDGPVPVSNLTGTAITIKLHGACQPSQSNWVCIDRIQMTLTEQSAGTISLPNATVEACYEGQCEGDKEENVEAMSLMLDEGKSIEDIEQDLNSVNEILKVVEEKLDNAEETNQTIIDGKQADQVKDWLEEFNGNDSHQDELIDIAHDIHENYSTFNEHASHLSLTTAVVDDILKQVTLVLEQDEEEIARLEDELGEVNESLSKQKLTKQTQDVIDENEKLADRIANLKETIANTEENVGKHQRILQPFEKSSQTFTKQLHGFYDNIQSHSDSLKGRGDDFESVRAALDVAAPAKGLEKQLNEIKQQMDETELVEKTTEFEQQIAKANEDVNSSVLSVPLAKRIGQLDTQIDEEIEGETATWEEQSVQLVEIEERLHDLVTLVQLPETLALEHGLDVLLEEKHDYRVDLFANVGKWQQLLTTLKKKQEEIEKALEQYGINHESLDELVNALTIFQERYTAAELSMIAHYLNVSAQLEQAEQLAELIENGQDVMQSIAPMIEETDIHLENLETLSSSLVNKKLMINTLNQDSFNAFTEELAEFEYYVDQIERPVKQLNNHLAIAEDLLGNRVSEYKELHEMYATIDTVADIMYRLEDLIEDLDALPYFGKIKGVITEMEAVRNQMDSMLQ